MNTKALTFNLITTLTLIFAATAVQAIVLEEKTVMDKARQSYQAGKLDKALELYNKIPQTSDFWVEALEEKAWTHLRKGETDKALSLITTLTSELLAPQIGPEPYFLKGLIDYRLCNIKGIYKNMELFRQRFKIRGEQLDKLKGTMENEASVKAIAILKNKKNQLKELKADDFGSDIQFLPRYFYRDRTVLAAAETDSDRRIALRLAQLAERESRELELILQKMHLLESQVVQQVFAYNKEMHLKRKAEFSATDPNKLIFPRTEEDWLDEIDNFEAATTDCPVDPLKGASL